MAIPPSNGSSVAACFDKAVFVLAKENISDLFPGRGPERKGMSPHQLWDGFHYSRKPGEVFSPDRGFCHHAEVAALRNQRRIRGLTVDPEINRVYLEGSWPRNWGRLSEPLGNQRSRKKQKKQAAAEHSPLLIVDRFDTRESRLDWLLEEQFPKNTLFTQCRKHP